MVKCISNRFNFGHRSGRGARAGSCWRQYHPERFWSGRGNFCFAGCPDKEFGVKVDYHGADLSQVGQIEDLYTYVKQQCGGIDILVNNAGIQHVATVEDFPVEKMGRCPRN